MLKRETRPPVRDARRPCVLVGAVLAVLFLAASVDAVLWQQSVERRYLEERAAAAEARAADAEARAAASSAEIEQLRSRNTELELLVCPTDVAPAREPASHPERWGQFRRRAAGTTLE